MKSQPSYFAIHTLDPRGTARRERAVTGGPGVPEVRADARSSRLRTRRSAMRAFTLVELLVVITIVGILLAIVLTGGVMMMDTTHSGNTRTILKELGAIATDYQSRTGNAIKPLDGTYPSATSNMSIYRFISQVQGNSPETARMFDNIDGRFKVLNNSTHNLIGFKDSWGHYIRYCYGIPVTENSGTGSLTDQGPGFLHSAGLLLRQSAATTGGISNYGSPMPYFASAGPDGKWGTFNSNNQPDAQAQDNIYSFDLKGHRNR